MKQRARDEDVVRDEIWKERACQHGTPEWMEAQAEALRKHGHMVSNCHPYVPATQWRDGTIRCGYFGDGKNPSCTTIIKKARIEPSVEDMKARAMEPETPSWVKDGEEFEN